MFYRKQKISGKENMLCDNYIIIAKHLQFLFCKIFHKKLFINRELEAIKKYSLDKWKSLCYILSISHTSRGNLRYCRFLWAYRSKFQIIKLHHNLTDRNDAYGCLRFFCAKKIYKTIFAWRSLKWKIEYGNVKSIKIKYGKV